MFSIKNISKRNIYFQGIMLAPYENIIVDKISDFVELSRLFNAGKVSYSRVSGKNTTEEEPKRVVEEAKVAETSVKTEVDDIKSVEIVEEPVKEEVVESVEETTIVEDKIEEVEEEKPKTKRSYNKKGKKLDI